jgi:phosphatidylserine decarboxylase
MKQIKPIEYYDRYRKSMEAEKVFAGAFLHWSYNSAAGRLLTSLVLRQKFVSALYGWYGKHRLSRRQIVSFAERMNVQIEELDRPLNDYASFNDFFTRRIDLSKRQMDTDPHTCIAPVDGKVLAYPWVDPERTFCIKRSLFNMRGFLGDDRLTQLFAGGAMVISRLCLADYHHIHFPVSGVPGRAIAIRGKYYAGGPYALRSLVPFYTENHRQVTVIDSDSFGQIAMVEIGAFTVGSIKQHYRPGEHTDKGARKGFFELGGSTVALLFQPGVIEIDEDLCSNTRRGIETRVRFGDSIGRTKLDGAGNHTRREAKLP